MFGNVLKKTKSDVKSVFAHPVWYLLFGLLFAAFLAPMIMGWLGSLKAKGGVFAYIPSFMTTGGNAPSSNG